MCLPHITCVCRLRVKKPRAFVPLAHLSRAVSGRRPRLLRPARRAMVRAVVRAAPSRPPLPLRNWPPSRPLLREVRAADAPSVAPASPLGPARPVPAAAPYAPSRITCSIDRGSTPPSPPAPSPSTAPRFLPAAARPPPVPFGEPASLLPDPPSSCPQPSGVAPPLPSQSPPNGS